MVESIITILNHPHFKGCHSIEDIQKKIASVNNLNERFGESDGSDEDECEGDDRFIEKKNIFLD